MDETSLEVQNPPGDSSKKSKVKNPTDAVAVNTSQETSKAVKEAKKRKSDEFDRQPPKSDSAKAAVDGSSKKVKKSKHKHDVSQNPKQAFLAVVKKLVPPTKVSEKSNNKSGENTINTSAVGKQFLKNLTPKTSAVVKQAKPEKQNNKKSEKAKEQPTTGAGATDVVSKHAIHTSQHKPTGKRSEKSRKSEKSICPINDSADAALAPVKLSHLQDEKEKKSGISKKELEAGESRFTCKRH